MSRLQSLEEIMSKFEGTSKLCHMGRELDPSSSKLSNSLG